MNWTVEELVDGEDLAGLVGDTLGDHDGSLRQGFPLGSLTHGLVGYYPLDGDATDHALDNDGTVVGATLNGSGQVGSNSFIFDGTDDYIEMGDIRAYQSDAFSVAAWVNIQSKPASNGMRMVSAGGGSYTGWGLQWTDNSDEFEFVTFGSGASNFLASTTPTLDTWHHVVATYRDGTGYLYVDGSQKASSAMSYDKATDSDLATIGKINWSDGDFFNGYIDDVRIYDRALSLPEIQALAARSTTQTVTDQDRLTAGLVGHWPLNEDAAGTAYDLSGRGNDSTSTTGTSVTAGVGGAQARSFDGTDDYISIPYNSVFDSDPFTLILWLKPFSLSSSGSDRRVVDYFSSGDYGYTLSTEADQLKFLTTSGGTGSTSKLFSNSVLSIGEWQQVGVTYDNATVEFIYNGQIDSTDSTTLNDFAPTNGNLDYWFGANQQGGSYTEGALVDIRLYNRVLSQSEIQALARLGGVNA